MDKYLLEILKDSNTIIIPGLGALTITNKDTGETMFMPYLQHDDGKLATFIAQKDGIDEADAKNMVAKYVRKMKAELDKGESYSMFKLGSFKKKDDGDIEFENWKNLSENQEEIEAPAVAPIVEEDAVAADEPSVADVAEPESEPIAEPEPEVVPEPIVEPEPVAESEPEVVSEPEPVVEPEPIEVSEDEIEIRETIVEAINSTPEIDEIIPERTTLEPSPLLDDIAPTAAVELDPEMKSDIDGETDGEPKEEKEKKKAGVGFWITIIIIALGIIAGGAYVGRNYNDLKQNIPFLADNEEEVEKESLKDEMSNVIKEDKYSAKPEKGDAYEESPNNEEEGFSDDDQGEETDNGSNETVETVTPPKPEVRKPKVTPPAPVNVSSSSSGPYKVVAGAFSSEANAKKLAAEFKEKGLKSEVFMKGALHAVSMQSYATSEEANANLSKLQSMAPGAWIYYKR